MKIGILIDRLNVGGVEKIAIEQVRALREIGEDVVLVVLRKKAVIEGAFSDLMEGVPIEYLDDRMPRWMKASFNFPVFHFFSSFHLTYPFLVPFFVKKNEYDYFICHGTYTAFTAITFRKIRKIPFSCFIWDPIGYILKRVYSDRFPKPIFFLLISVANFLDRMIIRNADEILVGGDAHNKHIRELNKNVVIKEIYPSVHPREKALPKKGYVLMVTAWKRGKNPEYIIELLKKMPSLKIKMVGKWIEDEYRKEFLRSLERAGFADNVEIIGAVDEKELQEYYAEASVFLQTNDDRGFGMPALEAAGNGTTFIIPQGQGVCALFEEGKEGFYTAEKDTDVIIERLKHLLESPEVSLRMGGAALERVQKNYSWKKHAEILQAEIHKCLK